MIIWIASYPKSGNTWVRAMLSAYFYSNDGNFYFKLLDNIKEFPKNSEYLNKISIGKNLPEIAKEWIPAQTILNLGASNKFFGNLSQNEHESALTWKIPKSPAPIIFLKTHSAICNINGSSFTDKENTLAAVYVVRDPRNVVSSISNHFDYSMEKSLEFIIDKNQIMANPTNENENSGLTILSDWKTHYQSWRDFKSIKVKIIKYEDLIYSTKNTFVDILNFFKEFIKIEFDKNKIKNVVQSTEFKKLKLLEQKYGFKESAGMSNRNKIFFNLGPYSNWRKLLDKKTSDKICECFESEMKELGYII